METKRPYVTDKAYRIVGISGRTAIELGDAAWNIVINKGYGTVSVNPEEVAAVDVSLLDMRVISLNQWRMLGDKLRTRDCFRVVISIKDGKPRFIETYYKRGEVGMSIKELFIG